MKTIHRAIPGLHLYICVINFTERQIIHNSDNTWASRDLVWLATLLFVQHHIPEKWNKKHYNSVLLIPHEENPLMTNWLAIQRASNAKNIYHVIPRLQVYICSSTFCKKKNMQKNIQQRHHMSVTLRGFHRHWQLYYLFFNPCIIKINETLSLATQWFVQQSVQEYTKENNRAPHYWSLVGRNRRWPMEYPHKRPGLLFTFVLSTLRKDKLYTTVTTHKRPGISTLYLIPCGGIHRHHQAKGQQCEKRS